MMSEDCVGEIFLMTQIFKLYLKTKKIYIFLNIFHVLSQQIY